MRDNTSPSGDVFAFGFARDPDFDFGLDLGLDLAIRLALKVQFAARS
jgi:hypothetical protein